MSGGSGSFKSAAAAMICLMLAVFASVFHSGKAGVLPVPFPFPLLPPPDTSALSQPAAVSPSAPSSPSNRTASSGTWWGRSCGASRGRASSWWG